MGRIQFNLGYGKTGDLELDPFVQLLTGQVGVDNQLRMDKPTTYNGTFEYTGIAGEYDLTSDNVWGIARSTWTNGRRTRIQYLGGVSWDDRVTLPWPP